MKQYHIILYVALLAILVSCKKENSPAATAVSKSAQQKLQSWFENQVKLNPGTIQPVLGSNAPNWGETEYVEGENLYLTPVTLKENQHAAKYFVANGNSDGEIKNGNYFIFLNKAGIKRADAEKIILPGSLNNSFTGAVLEYSINNSLVKATHYIDGKVTNNEIDQIANKPSKDLSNKSKTGENNNLASSECQGGEQYCIDWYWQTYINGILVYEEYLYTTCECVNQGGGSGGSGNPCLSQCQTQFNSLMSSTTVANDMLQVGPQIQTTPNTIELTYRWRALKNLTWGIYSNEKATLTKTNLALPYPQWKYVSLEHTSTSFEGFSVGGSVSNSATASITVGIYTSGVQLGLDVTYTPNICCGLPSVLPPYTIHYNASKIFHSDYQYQ